MYELNSDDINNLRPYVGKSLSYAKLCKLFNQDRKSHNSIAPQITQWKRDVNLIKNGTKYDIIEIYDTPKPQNLKFADYVKAIALFSKNSTMKKSMLDFQHYFGFTNSDYVQLRKNISDKESDIIKSDNSILNAFLEDFKQIIYRKFIEAKKSLISIGYSVKENMIISDTTEEGEEEDDNYHRKYRYPNPIESSTISELEISILKKLKCKDKRGLIIQKKNGIFYSRLNKALRNGHSFKYEYTEYEFTNTYISEFNDLYEHYKKFKVETKRTPLSTMSLDEVYNHIIPFGCIFNSCIQYITKNNLVHNNQDIKNYINNFRYSLNNAIIKLVRKHNKKTLDKFQKLLNEQSNISIIIDTLKEIYGEIDEQQYVKKYDELLESYVAKYVKLTPQTDLYNNNIDINEFSIINEVTILLETYPDSNLYLNS